MHHIVGDTGSDAHRALTGSEDFGQSLVAVPHTRIMPDGSREAGPATSVVPRTKIFSSGLTPAIHDEVPPSETTRVGVLDIGRILSEQNVHNIRLGDKIEVEAQNFGEPPPKWREMALLYEPTLISDQVTIHPEFSLAHPKAWGDGNGNWYYNFSGAVLLSAVMNQRLPTLTQLELAIRTNPELFQNSKGYYDPSIEVIGASNCYIHDIDTISHFWVAHSDPTHGNTATSLELKIGNTVPTETKISRRLFLPVRLVIEMPDEYYLARMDPPQVES